MCVALIELRNFSVLQQCSLEDMFFCFLEKEKFLPELVGELEFIYFNWKGKEMEQLAPAEHS